MQQREKETESSDNLLGAFQFQDQQKLSNVNANELKGWKKAVQQIVFKIEEEKLSNLLRIKGNPK